MLPMRASPQLEKYEIKTITLELSKLEKPRSDSYVIAANDDGMGSNPNGSIAGTCVYDWGKRGLWVSSFLRGQPRETLGVLHKEVHCSCWKAVWSLRKWVFSYHHETKLQIRFPNSKYQNMNSAKSLMNISSILSDIDAIKSHDRLVVHSNNSDSNCMMLPILYFYFFSWRPTDPLLRLPDVSERVSFTCNAKMWSTIMEICHRLIVIGRQPALGLGFGCLCGMESN